MDNLLKVFRTYVFNPTKSRAKSVKYKMSKNSGTNIILENVELKWRSRSLIDVNIPKSKRDKLSENLKFKNKDDGVPKK